jgi:hypothetical protein
LTIRIALAAALLFSMAAWASPRTKDDQTALRKQAKISMKQAEQTALGKEPGRIKSKELEKENVNLIYSFDIQTSSGIREVNVNAVTGSVVEDSVESPSTEAKEKQQDKQSSQSMHDRQKH